MKHIPDFLLQEHDPRDPNPWLAIYLDGNIPIADDVKLAWLEDTRSKSRQYLLPLMRPLARAAVVLVQQLKLVLPRAFTSSRAFHHTLAWSLKTFVSPNAYWLVLRHFDLGPEIQ